MPKSGLTSKAEGYGWPQIQARRRLIAALRDGDPCRRCGRPMYRWQAELPGWHRLGLDAGHADGAKALGLPPDRLEHRRCNRSAGATYGNRKRGHQPRRQRPRERRTATRTATLPEW